MNVHDSEKIAGIFSESGYSNAVDAKNADIIVLNTCNIRQKAEQKLYSDLGRLKKIKKNRPELKIAVAGCIAQQSGCTLFKRFPYVDFIFGPGNIDSLQTWLHNSSQLTDDSSQSTPADSDRILPRGQAAALQDNPEYHTKTLPMKREGQVKAWVSIMYGCDNFCAYCVVPYTRGRERSRESSTIYDEVTILAEQGFKEITLLGQNVNSYGKNLSKPTDFPELLKVVHDVKGIERIRFITSHPKDFSEKLIHSLKDLAKACEHMHLPLQAGSDNILHLMNRGYTYNDYKEKIDLLRERIPGIALTTDIIVGFPGETDEDFECTLTALKEIEADGIFGFKYSRRPDTRALGLPGHVKEEIKMERLARVLELQDNITLKNNKSLEGKSIEVLVEGASETNPDNLTGRTRTNKIVNFKGNKQDIGKLLEIKILEAKRHSLSGKRIQGV
jgi:tRNA-2-methylthio-N6-dimethylallyladenosine synthase